jgi:outer membrane protein OmpA-like peptidoglycan-associated protein
MRRLKQELQDRDEQIAALNNQLKRIESRLGGESQERIALQRQVDAQARLRANIAAIEASFTADEARVFRQGEDVVMSLLGINFPSGRSTIDNSSAALMRKVQQALAMFPDASILIEGHTDANGSDSANLLLSQDRADAVKQYLVSQFGINAEKVSSIGYGEARPVATNETAAGRARNRRIDLVIHVQGTG